MLEYPAVQILKKINRFIELSSLARDNQPAKVAAVYAIYQEVQLLEIEMEQWERELPQTWTFERVCVDILCSLAQINGH
jgi:hypothetical protein